jgi:hypothetical protein
VALADKTTLLVGLVLGRRLEWGQAAAHGYRAQYAELLVTH